MWWCGDGPLTGYHVTSQLNLYQYSTFRHTTWKLITHHHHHSPSTTLVFVLTAKKLQHQIWPLVITNICHKLWSRERIKIKSNLLDLSLISNITTHKWMFIIESSLSLSRGIFILNDRFVGELSIWTELSFFINFIPTCRICRICESPKIQKLLFYCAAYCIAVT